jgi:hypothetical protein
MGLAHLNIEAECMKTLKLELSLSEKGHVEVRVPVSPYGEALGAGPYNEKGADYFVDLNRHKRTFLKVLESQSSQPSDFSENAQSWLVSVGLLSQDRKHFVPNLHKTAGQMLYDALFLANDKAKQRLHDSQVRVSQKETLHIQFVINAEDDGSASLLEYPWELLFDKYEKKEFLASENITFSRYIAYGDAPPEWIQNKKYEVLLVSLYAHDDTLGLKEIPQAEHNAIEASLHTAEVILLETPPLSSFRDFGRYLSTCNPLPHIIHFDGHGLFGKKCKCGRFSTDRKEMQCGNCQEYLDDPQGYLLFKGEDTPSDLISAERLAGELNDANTDETRNRRNRIELVVLSTCQSGLALDNYTIFNGIAQRLIKFGIPAVVAMQFSVDISAAADFAERFYTSLGRNASIAEAMKNGRVGMRSSNKDNQWYRPVLYTRWAGDETGRLLMVSPNIARPTVEEPASVPPKEEPPLVQVKPPATGSFYERITQLHAQVEEKRSLLTTANAVFARQASWWDIYNRELEHLQQVSGPVQELSSCIDRADIGKLTEKENQLRNILKKPAHDSKGTLDELILQVIGLIALLKNRGSSQAENFEVRKSEYLFTIQSKFTTLKKNLDQLHSFMESCSS